MRPRLDHLSMVLTTLLALGCMKHEPPAASATPAPTPLSTLASSATTPAQPSSSAMVAVAVARRPSIRCQNQAGGELRCWFDVLDEAARAEILRHPNRDRLGLYCNRGVTRDGLLSLASSPGNVVTVGLSGCPEVDDLEPIKELKNLRTLELGGMRLRTLAPLSALAQLEVVIASNLHDLTDSDLMALAHKKTLHTLSLNGSGSIVDIRACDDMPALEVLDLAGTSVKDINPLRSATTLKTLSLPPRVTDIGALESLDRLRRLELAPGVLADLSPLKKLVHLEHLVANGVGARDALFASGLKELQSLSMGRNRDISNLAPLSGLTHLTSLTISGTSVKDLTPIAGLPALAHLDIQSTPVVEVAPLARIKTLKRLSVSKTVGQDKLDALKKALPELQITVR